MDSKKSVFASSFGINTIVVWFFCLTVLLLVIPFDNFSRELAGIIDRNRNYLYLALIIEASNFIAMLIASVYGNISDKKAEKALKENIINSVENLDFAEKALLREFVLQRRNVISLPSTETTVISLYESNILEIAGEEDANGKIPMQISKHARPYITYKAIGLTRNKMSDEMLNQIMDARPEFARDHKDLQKAYRGVKTA